MNWLYQRAIGQVRGVGFAFAALLFISVAVDPSQVLAANVTVPDTGLNLVLPSDGSVYTVSNGGTFDQLDISGGTITFTMTAGELVTITAANNRILTNDGGFGYTCSAQSSLTISATGSIVVNVTPGGSCSFSAGSGSGGSGGGSVSPVIVTTPIPTTATTSDQNLSTTTTVSAVPPVNPVTMSNMPPPTLAPVKLFKRKLSLGMSGNDVLELQKLLAQYHSVYPSGKITGYFGGLTKKAVILFQLKYHLSPVGIVGPKTRGILNKMIAH